MGWRRIIPCLRADKDGLPREQEQLTGAFTYQRRKMGWEVSRNAFGAANPIEGSSH